MNRFAHYAILFAIFALTACSGASQTESDSSGGGSTSTDTPTLTAPGSVTIDIADRQIILTWTAVDGATSYNVYWNTTGSVTSADNGIVNIADTTYIHNGLTNETTYYYVITANVGGEESPISEEVSATPTIVPPAPPSTVSVTAEDRLVTLEWKGSNNASSYNVYWNNTGQVSKDDNRIANLATTMVSHSGLSNDETYYYIIAAENSGGEGETTLAVSATPKNSGEGAVASITLVTQSGAMTLSWIGVAAVDTYNIYWNTTGAVDPTTANRVGGLTQLFYTPTDLQSGATYYFVVTSVYAGVESKASPEVSASY